MARVWLIGGTQESATLARSLVAANLACVVTIATESARSLYPVAPLLKIWVGRLAAESMPNFLQVHHVVAILDASHPFAVQISQLAIATAKQACLPYFRFERLSEQPNAVADLPLIFSDFPALLGSEVLTNQRVLLTIGYQPLPLFQPWQARATLFARILPSVTALTTAIAAGFTPDRLIALRPPISLELERSLWQQWQISIVVTKASGKAGGEAVKQQVAAELKTLLVVIARPEIIYPQQTSDEAEAISFCRAALICASVDRPHSC